MPASPFTVVQCWDDGVTTDARLTDLLRTLGIPATFNLCAGVHDNQRRFGWMHAGQEVWRLGWDEMHGVYDGFTIANHSLTHPNLCEMSAAAAQHEISVGRERLQQFFGQRVAGFAYPFGAYTPAVMALVRETGHVYARTVESKADGFPPAEPMAFHPSCHFLAPDFWQRYEDAKHCSVFYFWSHSFELVDETLWQALETTFTQISADPDSRWATCRICLADDNYFFISIDEIPAEHLQNCKCCFTPLRFDKFVPIEIVLLSNNPNTRSRC